MCCFFPTVSKNTRQNVLILALDPVMEHYTTTKKTFLTLSQENTGGLRQILNNDWSFNTTSCRLKDAGTWVSCQSPDRHMQPGREHMDYLTDRHMMSRTDWPLTSELWREERPTLVLYYLTKFTVQKNSSPRHLKNTTNWPQMSQSGTNMEGFPNIPKTSQRKRGYQMESPPFSPVETSIRS